MKAILKAEAIYIAIVFALALCTLAGSGLGGRNLCLWIVFGAIQPLALPLQYLGMSTPGEFFLRPAGLAILVLFYAAIVASLTLLASRLRGRSS